MPRRQSLRRRIAAAYVLLALAVCAFFALVVFFGVQEVERHFLERRLAAVGEWQLQMNREGAHAPLPPGFGFYAGPDIPVELAQTGPGLSELPRGNQSLLVLRGRSAGVPYVVVDEVGDFHKIRREILIALALGILGASGLAIVLGRLTAGRVIAPLTALAQAVQDDALDSRSPLVRVPDEIGVLARTFAGRTEELRSFLMRERLFTGDVSHELRTPLTIILGAAEVLRSRLTDRPDLAPVVERIERTARDTGDRVGALLLMSRSPESLDAPRLALRPVVEREIERCSLILADKPVELVFDSREEVFVFARGELVAMAVGNLLRNACYYTDRGLINVRLTTQTLEMSDTGPGVPAEVRDHLFERFVRGEGSEVGSGLGLAIVKRICEHLGWTIELKDQQGGGSRFVITFAKQRSGDAACAR